MKTLTIIGKVLVILIPALLFGIPLLIFSYLLMAPDLLFFFPLLIAVYIFLVALLIFKTFSWLKQASGKKAFFGVAALIAAIGLSFTISGLYKQSLARVGDTEVDLYQYMPFQEGTKAVKLDEPATMTLEGVLPKIDGATALYPMYAAFAQTVYPEKEYDVYYSEVMSQTTPAAYENLINGKVDVIFVAGPSDEQWATAKRAGKELKLTPIGKEAFVFFVNSKNKVDGLTMDEIRGIYSGEITNWKDVGGKNKFIRAFQRPEGSGSQTALQKLMGDIPIMDPPVENVIDLMGGIIDQVSAYTNYNNAIGYTFRYYSTEMVNNDKIRLLQVNGIEPNVETIRSGDYPIAKEFYAVTAGSTNPNVDKLIEWILSDQGQEIVEKTGYVGIQ